MTLRHYYRPSWRPLSTDPAIEFTQFVQLYTFDMQTNAEVGSVASSKMIVEDDDGTLDFPPLTRIWSVETEVAGSSNTYVHHGYIAERTVKRGTSQLTSAARVWELTVVDENSVFSRRILSSTNANRPAETDVQRVTWLANEADGQLLIDTTEFLFGAGAVSMDAVDYRGQTGEDVMNDCAQASGKNWYGYFKEGTGTGIWYGAEDHTARESMIRLSNVFSDIGTGNGGGGTDQNCYQIGQGEDTVLSRDPSRMVSGVYFQYANGSVYVRNQPMFQEIGMRDQNYSSLNVKTLTSATARANRYLADNDSEDDRITTVVYLPRAKVTWLQAGMRVRFRATHLPGYEDEVYLRVYTCSVAEHTEELYKLTLELGTNSIPDSPTSTPTAPPGSAVAEATLTIGSASHIGAASDRNRHFGSQVGSATPTLVVGKQYRIVMTITDDFNSPLGGYDSMSAFGVNIYSPAATITGPVTQESGTPGYNWNPDDGTDTASWNYEGIGYAWKNTGPPNAYSPGTVVSGAWLTWDGPATPTVDVGIEGFVLSGFWGFHCTAHVELQQRDPP